MVLCLLDDAAMPLPRFSCSTAEGVWAQEVQWIGPAMGKPRTCWSTKIGCLCQKTVRLWTLKGFRWDGGVVVAAAGSRS